MLVDAATEVAPLTPFTSILSVFSSRLNPPDGDRVVLAPARVSSPPEARASIATARSLFLSTSEGLLSPSSPYSDDFEEPSFPSQEHSQNEEGSIAEEIFLNVNTPLLTSVALQAPMCTSSIIVDSSTLGDDTDKEATLASNFSSALAGALNLHSNRGTAVQNHAPGVLAFSLPAAGVSPESIGAALAKALQNSLDAPTPPRPTPGHLVASVPAIAARLMTVDEVADRITAMIFADLLQDVRVPSEFLNPRTLLHDTNPKQVLSYPSCDTIEHLAVTPLALHSLTPHAAHVVAHVDAHVDAEKLVPRQFVGSYSSANSLCSTERDLLSPQKEPCFLDISATSFKEPSQPTPSMSPPSQHVIAYKDSFVSHNLVLTTPASSRTAVDAVVDDVVDAVVDDAVDDAVDDGVAAEPLVGTDMFSVKIVAARVCN